MRFKPFIFSALVLWCSAIITVQANNTISAKNNAAHATATAVQGLSQSNSAGVADALQSQSEWLYQNELETTSGLFSTRLLANDDPGGGKTCELADDLPVPAGETWQVDTIRGYLFWNKQQADFYQVYIYKDDDYGLPLDQPLYNFTFTANLPNELTIYYVDINVTNQNISLPGGMYWLSIIGVYNNLTMADEAWTAWNRQDILLGNAGALCRDSIGLSYTSYPIGWVTIFIANENPENSLRFWIRGTRDTDIITGSFQKPKSLVSVYPNPASDHILFRFDKTIGKYIEMYDVTGKLVQRADLKKDNNKVSVKNLKNGVYTYRLIGEAGRMIDKGRFTVSR
ncbi:T9SS type A sorting domain-containing protein [Fibrobacterota bacterium]